MKLVPARHKIPYHALGKPGPPDHVTWTHPLLSDPPWRARSGWEAWLHLNSEWAKGRHTHSVLNTQSHKSLVLSRIKHTGLTVAGDLCCKLAPNVPSNQSFRLGKISPLNRYLKPTKHTLIKWNGFTVSFPEMQTNLLNLHCPCQSIQNT